MNITNCYFEPGMPLPEGSIVLSPQGARMNVQELEGAELDAAVARIRFNDGCSNADYHPSTNWAQGGPIIEREGLAVLPMIVTEDRVVSWVAHYRNIGCTYLREGKGPTPLIAAMRAYVAAAIRRG